MLNTPEEDIYLSCVNKDWLLRARLRSAFKGLKALLEKKKKKRFWDHLSKNAS